MGSGRVLDGQVRGVKPAGFRGCGVEVAEVGEVGVGVVGAQVEGLAGRGAGSPGPAAERSGWSADWPDGVEVAGAGGRSGGSFPAMKSPAAAGRRVRRSEGGSERGRRRGVRCYNQEFKARFAGFWASRGLLRSPLCAALGVVGKNRLR